MWALGQDLPYVKNIIKYDKDKTIICPAKQFFGKTRDMCCHSQRWVPRGADMCAGKS